MMLTLTWRPTVLLLQEVTLPKDVAVVSIVGRLCLFEKRRCTRPRAVVAVRTGLRMSVSKVKTHDFYTRADVKLDGCDPMASTSRTSGAKATTPRPSSSS